MIRIVIIHIILTHTWRVDDYVAALVESRDLFAGRLRVSVWKVFPNDGIERSLDLPVAIRDEDFKLFEREFF
jgi:hypothetical protein